MAVDTLSLRLFQGFGVEIEYMIVDARTLCVRPITDVLIDEAADPISREVERDGIAWSNELAAHVVELKTAEPVKRFDGVAGAFEQSVQEMNEILARQGARLMPAAMHPWMDPTRETFLWSHDYCDVYAAFDRIFDCRRHGWANLQSIHLNLPFADSKEFARLHAAIRILLPILPALAASSPFLEGKATGMLDTRLDVYRNNSRKIGSIAGRVIPEPIFSPEDYQHEILDRIYREIAPYDPEGLLRNEWLNARGAIARFDRNAIEIRVIDAQECPKADLAICALVSSVLKQLVTEDWSSLQEQKAWSIDALEPMFLATIRDAERALIADEAYLELFGYNGTSCTASELWEHLTKQCGPSERDELGQSLKVILEQGPLARRILAVTGENPSAKELRKVYGQLCDCLATNAMFVP